MSTLRRYRFILNLFLTALMCLWQIGQPLQAATNWTSEGSLNAWSDINNWSAGIPTSADDAFFLTPIPNPGSLPNPATINLGSGSVANSLKFKDLYTLTGGDLALTSGTIDVDLGVTATINSQLTGNAGLTKTGKGAIRLANGNSYTGTTTINNGIVVIGNQSALGADLTPIIINGSATRGFGGGMLVLEGGYGSGMTFSRDISLQGLGPIGANSGALVSVGDNTITGTLSNGAALVNTAVHSASGRLTLSDVTVGGTAATTFLTFGYGNSTGAGSYAITGVLSGTGSLNKTGAGTLLLTPSNAAAFAGTIRVSAGSIRVTSPAVLGTNTGTTTSSLLNLQGDGTFFEFRADSLAINKNVYQAGASGSLFADHALDSNVINGTATFGALSYEVGETLTFNSRNGYGMSFTTGTVITGDGNSTLTNNLTGTLTFTGTSLWNHTNNEAARTLSMAGTGNTVVTGGILATSVAFNHNLSKSGTGTLTILGVNSTLDGNVTTSGGALAITDFRSLTNSNSMAINIGSGTTAGILTIGTSVAATAAGLTTSKVINLNGSTGGATINANQAGANPVILNSNFTATGGTASNAKTLTLSGTNMALNTVNGIIPNNAAGGTVNLTKTGAGTWQLAGENAYSGNTTIADGTLKLKANGAVSTIINDLSPVIFTSSGQTAGGTLELVGQDSVNNVETLASLAVTNGSNTVRLTPGAGGSASLVFNTLGAISGAATVNFVSPGPTSAITFNAGVTPDNIHNAGLYYNGTDFGFIAAGGVLRAPVYGTDADFVTSATALTAGASNEMTGSFTSGAAITIDSLKINGSQTLTMGGLLTIQTNGTTGNSGGILFTGGTGAISGTGISTGTTATASAGALVIRVNGSGDTLTLNAPLTSNGTGGFTKSGAGTLIIAGTNAQTGTTTLNEGTLRLSGTGRLAAASAALNQRQGTILDLNGVNTAITANTTSIGAFNSSGTVTNTSSTPVTFAVGGGTSGGTGTFSGTINETAGKISVIKMGTTNSQTWNGISNYTGSTTIGVAGTGTTGSLTVTTLANIGTDSSIGRGDVANNAGSLVFGGTTGGLIYTGTTSVSTDRLFTLNSTSASGGATITNNSATNQALVFSNPGAIAFTGPAKLFQLAGSSTGDNWFYPQINDVVAGTTRTSLTKNGTGLWILGNTTNSYSGATTVANGILRAQTGSTLPTASNLVLSGGVFESTGTFSRTLGTGADQFQFSASPLAKITGFSAGSSKLTVNWGSGNVWGSTVSFLGARDGLLLNSISALSEIEIPNAFSLGTASGPSASVVATLVDDSASITLTSGSTAGLIVGQYVTGTNIPANAYITSITSGTVFTISAPVTAGDFTLQDLTVVPSNMRVIQVNDNTTTFTDFATLSGAISGNAGTGIRKFGTGTLQLFGVNTYDGQTNVAAGTLTVNSLGNSASAAGSSVGTGTNAHLASNAISLGNGSTTGATLQYVGKGETSDRMIRLNTTATTTASPQIHADGTGPLILTNVVNDMALGAKVIYLRGSNTQGNMITSNLGDNGGALGIVADGAATWILTGNNAISGTISITGGALGIGSSNAFGTGTVAIRNGSMFAYGQDRVISNPMSQNTTSSAGTSSFIGDYSIKLLGDWNNGNTSAGHTMTNTLATGKTLTLGDTVTGGGNLIYNALTGNITLAINGTGDTILNGNITTSTAFNVSLTYTGTGTGSLTLSGTGSDRNAGALNINGGTLRLGNNEVIAHGGGVTESGNVTMAPAIGATAILDLNGKSETINGFTANGAGATVIDNKADGTSSDFTFGANDQTVSIGAGTGTFTITDSGVLSTLSLIKTGTAAATIASGVELTYSGDTSVTGGTLAIASALNGTRSLNVSGSGSVLALTGGITSPTAIKTVSVADGSTLSLLDGTGNKLTSLTALTLGSSSGTMTTLNLNVGDLTAPGDNLQTDTLGLLTGGALNLFAGNKITFNLTDAGLNENQTYVLINVVDGGLITGNLGMADYILGGTPGGFESITINRTNTTISITTGALITVPLYWTGLSSTAWNENVTNWSLDKAGTLPASSIPGQGTDVIFAADNLTSAPLVTTLEQNFKIKSLTFEASTTPANTPASVTINPGTVATNRIEIAPSTAAAGINITAGGPASVTINAPVKLGSSQTWGVADAASTLTLATLLGEADVTKAGLGRVVISAAADSTFNVGQTTDVTVEAGALELTAVGALGTPAANNLARIKINGGLFYFNGAASTTANPITLNGGVLAAGGGTQTYSGLVTIDSASTIRMLDPVLTTATGRSITLSGGIAGAGNLTLDGITTVTSGNEITGTLTLNQSNAAYTGDILLLRGTIATNNASGLGTGANITFEKGRIQLTGATGTTWNLAQKFTIASATATSVGELSVAAGLTVNFSGLTTLGGAGGLGTLRLNVVSATSQANFDGGIVLANDGGIVVAGVEGSTAYLNAPITETGGSRSLILNNIAAWTGTARTIVLNAVNTYSGSTTIASGTVQLGIANSIPTGSVLTLGTGSTAAILDLNGFDQTIAGLNVTTSSASLINRLMIGTGKTLTVNGNVTIGADVNASTTLLTAEGGGSLVVNSSGGRIQVGGATGGTNENAAIVDLSALGSFTANLGTTGIFNIGDVNTGTGVANSVVTLAANSTINTGFLRVGDSVGGTAGVHVLNLGTGTNVINANTINIGSAGSGIRSGGTLKFGDLDTTGSVTIRGSLGGSAAATINVLNTTGNTGGDMVSIVDFSGHTADVIASTLTLAMRTTGAGAATSTLSFDQGTLVATTLNMASRTGGGTGAATATVNLGDSAAAGTPTTTIGTLNMAVNTSGGGLVISTLNITGGNVAIGTGSGNAINMANAASGRTATSAINITGGAVTVTGNVARTGGAGTESATVTLDGGLLNMSGYSMGTTDAPVTFVAAKGTLQNLGGLNGNGALNKTTAGILFMTGTNSFTGDTLVDGGVLLVNGAKSGLGGITVGTATLGGSGSISGAVTLSATGILSPGTVDAGGISTLGQLSVGTLTATSGSSMLFQLGAATLVDTLGIEQYQANPGTFTVPASWTTTYTSGTEHDRLQITGDITTSSMAGTTLLLETLDYTPDFGSVFHLMNWDGLGTTSIAGPANFSSLPVLNGGALSWNTQYFSSHGIIFVVPEPGRMLLLMLGFMGLFSRRRRQA